MHMTLSQHVFPFWDTFPCRVTTPQHTWTFIKAPPKPWPGKPSQQVPQAAPAWEDAGGRASGLTATLPAPALDVGLGHRFHFWENVLLHKSCWKVGCGSLTARAQEQCGTSLGRLDSCWPTGAASGEKANEQHQMSCSRVPACHPGPALTPTLRSLSTSPPLLAPPSFSVHTVLPLLTFPAVLCLQFIIWKWRSP